jgi:long-chain acyl-CoA synthetase
VYPDTEVAQSMGFTHSDLENIMEQNRKELNAVLPSYSKISSIRIQDEEFEKTPKKSIKRFLYLKG